MAQFAPTVPRVDDNVFLVLAYDVEDSAEIRERELDGHLQWVEKHCEQYLVAGPLREPGADPLIGSFFLVAAASADDAEQIVSGDPYVKSGLYREIRVHAAVPAGGRFMGGVIWESADAIRDRASG
jgi:uncharacterized protein YciI